MSGNAVIEEIKSKLDIVQIISEYVPLKKAGVRFRAPCPFHHEKDPSFYVNPDWQIWKCFGCGEGGDIFDFVMRLEGLEFPDALRHLADKAGVTLRADDLGQDKERQRLFEVNRLAALYFHEVLLRSPVAAVARAYAEKRLLSEATLDEFMIGFAPDDWHATSDFLKRKGFTEGELVAAGLVGQGERGNYDRFRNRLTFPIRNAQGHYVGFSGRIMPGSDGRDPEGAPKYVNTIETPIYRKSDVLFAFDLAKQPIRRSGTAVVVEGNMDAVASHQADVRNVVASSGTAFTAEQLGRLRRVADRLVLSFDNDAAGEQAARRSIEAAVAAGFEVHVLRLPPDVKDPDDCIRRDPALWRQAIDEARPYMDWYFSLAVDRADQSDPYAKRRMTSELLAEIAKLPTAVERAHWLRRLSELFGIVESELATELAGLFKRQLMRKPTSTDGTASVSAPTKIDRQSLITQYVLGLVAAWPTLGERLVAECRPEWLSTADQALYAAVVLGYNQQQAGATEKLPTVTSSPLLSDSKLTERLAILQLLAEKEFGEMKPEERRHELGKLIGEIKELHAVRLKRELVTAMRQAENDGNADQIATIQRQLNDLII